ncbi:hypothetical protein C491_13992 [Natronococcus amylolyticus DSM 10524]|uniref:Uncharacterized protein n=1 Tax=Natronococcus amylolyticus DSM 10524 TaxID=1227497 RepID=L9X3P1_9EURY|nr:hypothetical protein [Natronococcus amylolyticus]ELY56066.1 hypothetical protein C491_13992 [Natronococcus amylolyticus DSM 10524]
MNDRSGRDSAADSDADAETTRKVAAVCTTCGKAYASEQRADGTIRPIGQRTGCKCGETSFEVVDSTEAAADD